MPEGTDRAVYPDRIYYTHVKPEDAERIVNDHVVGGHVIKELQMFDTDRKTGEKVYDIEKIGFYEKQQRIALRNCGRINPENIYEYIGIDGYEALYHVLTEKTPQEVIDIVKASGLRGRGGAGFSTGLKWQFEKDQPGDEKYVICNAAKVTRAHSWIVPFWKAIRTPSWKAWRSWLML